MREGAPDDVMSTTYRWRPVVQSWSPTGELLAEDIPLLSGDFNVDVSGRSVPEQAPLVVPRDSAVNGQRMDWLPGFDVEHPLATFGQQLSLGIEVSSVVSGRTWFTDLGRVRIENWEEADDGSIRVTTAGLLQLPADDKLAVPQSPDAEASLVSEFARLLPGVMTVSVDAGVEDRPALPGTQWAGSKLDSLYDIAEAIPARLRSAEDGTVLLLPPLPELPKPVAIYRDGEVNGATGMATLVSAPRSDTRAGVINSVTVLSQFTTGAAGQNAAVVVEQTTGPFAVDTYGRVNETWSNEQIKSEEEARAAGKQRLAEGLRPARTLSLAIAPDPRLAPDDPIMVIRDQVVRTGYVLGVRLDLTGASAMQVTMSIETESAVPDNVLDSNLRAWSEGVYSDGVYGF